LSSRLKLTQPAMLRIFPYFFLVIMTLFVVVPTADQLWGKAVCKIATVNNGMAEEEVKVGKEVAHIFYVSELIKPGGFIAKKVKKSLFPANDTLVSELFALLPEMPPDAC
jgi:hypothetical protein